MNQNTCSTVVTSLLCSAILAACATGSPRDLVPAEPAAPLQLTVMTFNVENLFDNEDDPGKDDKAYLPIEAKRNAAHINACNDIEVDRWRDECLHLDWSDATLKHKLSVLADTIRSADRGRGADIIALQEVENRAILERLRDEYLRDLGYQPAILVEGADLRGIDVAFLSRLPLAHPPILHPLSLPGFPERTGDTRGVLQADFELPDGSVLTAFSVHFPAPFHPTGMRVAAYEHLNELLRSLPEDRAAVAGGDFNTTSSENAETRLLDRYARPYWTLAHDIGCLSCKGTHYYARGDSWSFLDMILFAAPRGENTTARIRADSVDIVNGNPQQVSDYGTPQRYDGARRRGVSDHWPMIATIELAQKQ